ncbi:hypothetical protein CSOJ01_04686 [Colletotrichum sojae]|uniref:Uncharacterized protein n=1 Tax=Colletotrichum sojae TaxID=2175907 RepID=A0A8H6JHS8_9PEZI|nr:hypothetical protein CSOJ01_04686 [Colletotrichum sojae]
MTMEPRSRHEQHACLLTAPRRRERATAASGTNTRFAASLAFCSGRVLGQSWAWAGLGRRQDEDRMRYV